MCLKGTRDSTMPDRRMNIIIRLAAAREMRLGPPAAKRLIHDVDVIQEHYQRPEPSQAVKRQDALLVTRHHRPFLRAFEQSVPLYTLMDLAYILTRKTPRSGGFGGLAHLYVHCPEPRPPAARPRRHPPYSASATSSRRTTSSMRMASPCLAPAAERPMSTPMPVM